MKKIVFTMILVLSLSADSFTNSIGMKFVKMPSGSFMMGAGIKECPKDDPFTSKNEARCMDEYQKKASPTHKVTLKSFYITKKKVNQEQWYKIMGSNPSYNKGKDLPVTKISRKDIHSFIKKLNKLENTTNYSLQSEAQWEYTARMGVFDDLYKTPYDMIEDCWSKDYKGAPTDGSAWLKDCSDSLYVRGYKNVWYRNYSYVGDIETAKTSDWGFRVVYKGTRKMANKSVINEFTKKENITQETKKKIDVKTDAKDASFFNSLDDVDSNKPVNIE